MKVEESILLVAEKEEEIPFLRALSTMMAGHYSLSADGRRLFVEITDNAEYIAQRLCEHGIVVSNFIFPTPAPTSPKTDATDCAGKTTTG